MKINYILSETTSGATSATIREIVKRAERDVFSNVIVLVPEPKSIAIEREILDESKAGAFANVFVYSFVRLLSRIGDINEQDLVSKQTCVMILRKIILENLDKLTCYKKTAKTLGFAEKIYETIAQFKASSLSVQEVKEIAEKATGALKSKMQDIAFLFGLYEEALGDRLFDDCDRLRKLGELAKSSEFIKNADIFVVGFDNVTTDMLDVLKEFTVNSKSITFSCVYFNEKRKDKYIQNNELFHKFASISEKLKYPYNPTQAKSVYTGDFWNIQNYLYSTESKQVESKGNVKIFELENKTQELRFVANQILSAVKNGKRFKDIAVIDAELEKDTEAIIKIFDEYSIPYYISRPYEISEHYFVRFLKLSIEVLASNLSSDKVLRWLASPILEVDNFAEFENYVKEFGINYSLFLKEADEKQIKDDEKRERINLVIKVISGFYNGFNGKFSGEKEIKKFIDSIEELALNFGAVEKIEKISAFEKEAGLDAESEISNKILEKFKKVNENLSRFLGNQKSSALEFLQIYMSGFSEEDVNLVPASVDLVFVQKKADGLYKIKDLFIVGAVEGSFPVKMADTGVLQDAELEGMSDMAHKRLEPTIKDINRREKYLCFELMLIPSENLTISYSLRSGGVTNKPAGVITRLKNLFGIKIQKNYALNSYITKQSAEKQFAKNIGAFLDGEIISQNELNEQYSKLNLGLSSHFRDYIENLSFGEKEFKISSAKEIYFLNNKTSVSQLERYFSCPYSFFARYGLRLKQNKDASLTSLEIGTIVHKFAEIFTKNIKDFDNLSDQEFDKKTKAILTTALEELEINTKRNVAILHFVYDEVLRLGKYLYLEQQSSSFKNDPRLNEFEFFGNNAVKIQVDENTVISIEGKIDRIDKFGSFIRIIDYKTGDIDNSLNSIYFGKKIQLVSYLSALEKIGDNKIAGLFFFPIHSDFVKNQQKLRNIYKMQGFLLDDIDTIKYMDSGLSIENNESDFVPLKIKNNKDVRDTGEFQISYGKTKTFMKEKEFESIKNYTENLCASAISEILDGYIEPSPIAKPTDKTIKECEYCELNGFCGKERARFGQGRRCGGAVSIKSFNSSEEGDNG